MSYADGLLSTGERILYRNKQHPFIFIWGARYAILAVVIALIALWLGGNLDPAGFTGTLRGLLGWVTAALFIGGIGVFIWTALTASESGIEKMRMLRSPVVYKKKMLDAKHDYEVDMERAGWAPSPPIRDGRPAQSDPGATTAPTASIAAPVAASAPPAARTSDPDEVTRTLASLADLRDRGAISPEEYETKKADLLGRL